MMCNDFQYETFLGIIYSVSWPDPNFRSDNTNMKQNIMTFYELVFDIEVFGTIVEVEVDNLPIALFTLSLVPALLMRLSATLVTHSTPPSVPALLSTLLASIFLGLLPFDKLSQILLLLLQPFPLLTLLLLPLARPVVEMEVDGPLDCLWSTSTVSVA